MHTKRLPMMSAGVFLVLTVSSALLTGCGGGGGGAPGADVTGTVRDDSTLEPLMGAIVEIAGVQSQPTDANGQFTVANVGVGTQQMNIYKAGYQTRTYTVPVPVGGANLGDLYLPLAATPGKGHVAGIILETFDSATGQLDDPVEGATVVSGGKTARSKTDGTFAIYNITPGQTSVVAEFNTKLARANIMVPADTTTSVTLRLSISPPAAPAL